MQPDYVIDLFKQRGYLDEELAGSISEEASHGSKEIDEILKNFGVIEEKNQIYAVLAQDLGAEFVDLDGYVPPAELVEMIPAGMARLHGAFPINAAEDGLHVAFVDPFNPQNVEDLRFALGKEIVVVVADATQVDALIGEHYGSGTSGVSELLGDLNAPSSDEDLEQEANSAPIVRFVDLVLLQAIREKASDIHFEPFEEDFKIRYRVDGALYEMAPPPRHLALSVISRVKVMANLNIAERRIPQDGRIEKSINGKPVDLRVSTLPTQHGESVVLRVLDRSAVNLDLDALKLPQDVHHYICDTIEKPNGIFIVTGPTGAGKTTTLYAALRRINTIDHKLLTAEDPVEYDIDGIIQVPVNDGIGLNFSRVLRAFLRQDPDRIMVGEMRDLETAQIAIQASLTGHLVLSTLHTNDAAGAITRLIDMGCEPFLVAATLEGVLGQRLLRTICPDCKVSYEPSEAVLAQLGLSAHELGDKDFYTGKGCEKCGNSGYRGRRGLYELLDVNDEISDLIVQRAPTIVIRQKAIELGMRTLREDGLANIYEGNTTIEEVLKYT
ncbi:MAG: GspE/PulE family protein [Verrucomicrobiota bacterium]